MSVPREAGGGRSRWQLIHKGHVRVRSELALARISLDAVRLMAHSANDKARGRVAYARAAERYDEARRLLDQMDAELDAVERNRGWEPLPVRSSPPVPWERRSGADRRSGRDRRVLTIAGVRLERRQGERREAQRRSLAAT